MTDTGSREAAGTRSQGVVHIHTRHHPDALRLLGPVLDRPRDGTGLSVLVVTPTTEDAIALSSLRAAIVLHDIDLPLLAPVTSVARGQRLLESDPPPPAVIGSPIELAALLGKAQLKLDTVRSVALVWPEELLDDDRGAELEALLAEVPRSADRIGIVARPGPALDAFLERSMWKARHIDHRPATAPDSTELRFLAVGPEQRLPALRAVLDVLDPPMVGVIAASEDRQVEAALAAGALGLRGREAGERLMRGNPAERVALLVIFGVPTQEMLADLTRLADDIVVIVGPGEVPALRVVSGGGARPFSTASPIDAARNELEALRDRVRAVVAAQGHLPWMAALEPLLTDLDPVEVAAGALALVHRSRRMVREEAAPAAAAPRTTAPPAVGGNMTRVFFGIGERDGVRRNDLVGAITGEAGITGSQIGKIVVRDAHSVVEVDSTVATPVIRKMNGVSLRGRKMQVREDREPADDRPPRGAGGRGTAGPRGGGRGFGDRPGRGGPRGPRAGGPRRDDDDRPRGPRFGGPHRTDDDRPRGPRSGGPRRDDADRPRGRSRDIERMPRAARESEEWTARGDRLRHARRRPPRDES